MKKLLTFALAVLMLATTVISTAAVNPWNEPFVSGSTTLVPPTDSEDLSNAALIEYYKLLFGGNTNLVYPGYINPGNILPSVPSTPVYTRWYDSCDKCDGVALFYVEKNVVYWSCLEKDCDGKGNFTVTFPETDKPDTDSTIIRCPDCKFRQYLIHLDTVVINNVITERYFCTKCGKVQYFNATNLDSVIPKPETPLCSERCGHLPEFDHYFYAQNAIYARFTCKLGHYTDVLVYTSKWPYYDTYKCNVRVNCTTGGRYMSDGYGAVTYGTERTFAFYANKGYMLTDVVVNGESYGAEEVLTLKITQDTVINAYFEKGDASAAHTVTTKANGNGKIGVVVNSTAIANSGKFIAKNNDTVKLSFIPLGKNYAVADVKVNGKSVGAKNEYKVAGLKDDLDVEVTFKWVSPFADVAEKYEKAVQYVCEAGIMDYTQKFGGKAYFNGKDKVLTEDFVCALIEMIDTGDEFDTDKERISYAILSGIISRDTDIDVYCDVQTAAKIVDKYLEVVEKANKISFDKFDAAVSVEKNAVNIGLVSAKGYKNNRDLTRYDLASVCYLISNLEFHD